MTFLGFNIDKETGNLIDEETEKERKILEENIMDKDLFETLQRNKVNLEENFDDLPRYFFFCSRSELEELAGACNSIIIVS